MKHLRNLLLVTCFFAVFMLAKNTALAAPLSYVDESGENNIDISAYGTDDSTDSDFTHLKEWAAANSKTILAFVYSDCRSAASPADIPADGIVKVITQEGVGAGNYGTVGGVADAIWYVYDNKLYITKKTGVSGTVTVADTYPGGGDQDVTTTFTGATSEAYYPTRFYSNIDGATPASGVQDPTVGDEQTYADDEFYTFVDTQDPTYAETIANRDNITINSERFYHHNAGTGTTMRPQSVGWVSLAPNLTEVHISDDIALSGNMNGLFNANFTFISNLNGADSTELRDSIYTNLEKVYLYCDMSQVTEAAGMFARCPKLTNIYVRTGSTKAMPNLLTTAYMFYGDKLLTNAVGEDSFIEALDLSGANGLVSTEFMFGGCEAIERPNVSGYHMNGVKWAKGMFFGAKNARLKTDTSSEKNNIAGWNLSGVVDATAMFSGGNAEGELDSTSLNDPLDSMDPGLGEITNFGNVVTGTIDMTGWNMNACQIAYMMFSRNGSEFVGVILDDSYPALIDASGMFLRCDYLGNVQMPSNMQNLKNSTIMFKMAGSKADPATASIAGWLAPELVNADFMFYGSGFTSIDTEGMGDLAKVKSAKGMFGECSKLQNLGSNPGAALGSVTFAALEDGPMMFINDTALVKVDTSGWRPVKAVDLSFMFQNTPALTSGVDLSQWGITSTLTNMECFADGSGMSSYDYSGWNTANVTDFAFAFADNPNLTTVTPATSTSPNALLNAETMFGMFSDDPALVTVSGTFPAPATSKLTDVGGMFANDTALTTVGITNLLKAAGTNAEYFMKNCENIESVDISGWVTSNVVWMQGFLDNAYKLKNLTVGTGFSAASLKDTGTMLRNNYVITGSSVNNLLKCFENSSNLEDAYEMMKNDYALVLLDMSPMDLSSCTDLRRVAAMLDDGSNGTKNLVTIKLPESILTAPGVKLKDDDNTSINMFYLAGDESTETDDTLTTLFLDGTPGTNILAYAFGGDNGDNDNRSFVKYNGRTINGNSVGTYILADPTDSALMDIDAVSTLYKGGTTEGTATNVPLTYVWTKDGSTVAGEDGRDYETLLSGTYVAKALPTLLTGANSSKSATFIIGASPVGITATYTGPDIPVGENYSLDDLEVKLIDSDGNEYELTPTDFTVDSQKVTKNGDNSYTVTYTDGTDTFTTTVKVPGYRKIGSITATYNGPSVVVGKEYDPAYVTVMAYYADDTSKKEGFEVTPTSLSSLKVTAAGDNTYTATYKDPKQDDKEFTAQYKVNGYKTISSIAATYTGDKIKVGNKYNKGDVKVTLYYADGSGSATTDNFTVDSQTVTYEGGNSYTAYYRDPFGNVYSAGFSVPGYKDGDSSSSGSSSSGATGTTASTVVAPSQVNASGAASTVKKGTSTGVVQTGTTGKTVLYLIAIIALGGLIFISIKVRKSIKKD